MAFDSTQHQGGIPRRRGSDLLACVLAFAVACSSTPGGSPAPTKLDVAPDATGQAEISDAALLDLADGAVPPADASDQDEATVPDLPDADAPGPDPDATDASSAQDGDAQAGDTSGDEPTPPIDATACSTNTDCPPASPCDNASCSGGTCLHVPDPSLCNDGYACTIDTCNVAAGCVHTPVADPNCGVVSLSHGSTLACDDPELELWQRSGTDLPAGSVRWRFDAKPALPGAFSPACSLNVNNDKDLTCGPGQASIKATADSPWYDGTLFFGEPIALHFTTAGSLNQGQTASVLVRTAATDWAAVGTVAPSMAWESKAFASAAWAGQKLQFRFQLEGPCGTSTATGWFVDDIVVQSEACALGGGCPSDTACSIGTTGSVICQACKPGFHIAATVFGPACVADDKCATPGICGPHGSCKLNPGTNNCTCKFGYVQVAPKTCVEADECAEGMTGCTFYQTCVNLPGSFACKSCPDGYAGPGCAYVIGTQAYPAAECHELLAKFPSTPDGMYWLKDFDLPKAQYYCDMKNGGWTLVISDDFEDKKLAGWSEGGVSTCGGLGSILGGFDILGPGAATTKTGAAPGHLQYKLTADVLFFGSWNGEKVSLLVNGKEVWSQAMVASPGVSASGCGSANFADTKVSMAVTVDDLQYAGPIEVKAASSLASGSKASFGLDNVKLWSR